MKYYNMLQKLHILYVSIYLNLMLFSSYNGVNILIDIILF